MLIQTFESILTILPRKGTNQLRESSLFKKGKLNNEEFNKEFFIFVMHFSDESLSMIHLSCILNTVKYYYTTRNTHLSDRESQSVRFSVWTDRRGLVMYMLKLFFLLVFLYTVILGECFPL